VGELVSKRSLVLTCLSILGIFPSPSTAQQPDTTTHTAGVYGTVRDSGGRALPGTTIDATILVADSTKEGLPLLRTRTTTDDEGRYRLEALPTGVAILAFRRIGFAARLDTLILNPDVSWEFDPTLGISVAQLAPVTVVGQEDKYDRRISGIVGRFASGAGTFITRAQIDSLNPSTTSDLLRRRKGIIVNTGVAGSGKIDIPQQVPKKFLEPPCPGIRYFVDGVEMPVDSEPRGLDSFSPDEIETIEVYRYDYETPPEFLDPGRNCGAIAIWTRERGSHKSPKRPAPPPKPKTRHDSTGAIPD
jgi:hypothetical protein